jgi:Esterase FrsA-like
MYEPFPGNYVWNLSVNICVGMGGAIGEMDKANERVREQAKQGEDAGTEAFFSSWIAMADGLIAVADETAASGHSRSAAEKYARATAYYVTAERMQSRHYAPRKLAYRTMLQTMQRAIVCGPLNCERVEMAYEGKSFPALFVRGAGEGPRPCMVFCNGLDSVKEMIYLSIRDEFAKRGISCLMVDQPGVGEALRLGGLHAVVESERWANAQGRGPRALWDDGLVTRRLLRAARRRFREALQALCRLGCQPQLG